MTFDEWLKFGQANNWISSIVCDIHEGTPMTSEEMDNIDQGLSCIYIARFYEEAQERINVLKENQHG